MIVTTQQNLGPELDLSSSGAPPRNWRGIGLAMVVISVVLSLVLLSIFLLSPENEKLPEKSSLTLSDLESMEYQVYIPHLYWTSHSEIIMECRERNLIKLNVETKKPSTLLSNITLMSLKASSAEVSSDLQNVLMLLDKQQVVGLSFKATYAVYNIRTRELWDLMPPRTNETTLQHAAWGPQGSQLVFVYDNDIYYQKSALSPALRLTSSGKPGTVLNGITDWTYQDEILHTYSALWWSPDGTRLAYLSINNSLVPNMELPHFVGADYPSSKKYAYPKAGQPIPWVKVYAVNLNGPSHSVELLPSDTFQHREYYITLVRWISNDSLAVQWLNRPQNLSVLIFCDATTGVCMEKYRASSERWISIQGDPVFSTDAIFLPVSVKQGAQGEFVHVAMMSTQLGSKEENLRMLTSGDWDVTRIVAYNLQTRTVYFLSTEAMARRRHLYSVETSGSLDRSCVTCDLFPDCNFVDAIFSSDCNYFILYCKGPGTPQVSVHHTQNPRDFLVIEDNKMLRESLSTKDIPEIEFRSIRLDKYDLTVRLTLPSGYQDSLFPLVVWLPEALGSQQVTEEFSLGWESVLVSSFRIILAQFDGRGSKNRGMQLLHDIDHRLGSAEIKDYQLLAQHLKRLPFVDKKSIGVFGKAYGGFLALKLLALSEDMFTCGVAVAPVTNFHLHSALISERYLGLPSQETSAYMMASVLNDIQKLEEKQFLLVHGTADVSSFPSEDETSEVPKIYPDEDHCFMSKGSRYNLQQSIISYLQNFLETGGRRFRSQ